MGYEIQTSSFKRRTFDTIIVAVGITAPAATPGLLTIFDRGFIEADGSLRSAPVH